MSTSQLPEYCGSLPDGKISGFSDLRPGFGFDDLQDLDAPIYLPCGSHRVERIHQTTKSWFFTCGFGHRRGDVFSPLPAKPAVKSLAVPASVQAGAPAKKSNLDVTRLRIVKRGALVSWHGFRFHVSRVRSGTCYPVFPIELTDKTVRFLPCNSVQVVA